MPEQRPATDFHHRLRPDGRLLDSAHTETAREAGNSHVSWPPGLGIAIPLPVWRDG